MNQSVSGVILLNKPNTELSGFIKKKTKKKRKMVRAAGFENFEPRSPAWQARDRCGYRSLHECTYSTHFRTLQLYHINNVRWSTISK